MLGTQAPLPCSSFRRAVQQFKDEHLNKSECEQFQFTELKDLESSLSEIQDEQASESRMNRLRKFLEGMKLIEVSFNASEFVAFVWVRHQPFFPSSPRLPVAENISSGSDEIPAAGYEESYQSLRRFT